MVSGTTEPLAGTEGPRTIAIVLGGCVGNGAACFGKGTGCVGSGRACVGGGTGWVGTGSVGPSATAPPVVGTDMSLTSAGNGTAEDAVVPTGSSRAIREVEVDGFEVFALDDVATAERVSQIPTMAKRGSNTAVRRRVIRTLRELTPRLSWRRGRVVVER